MKPTQWATAAGIIVRRRGGYRRRYYRRGSVFLLTFLGFILMAALAINSSYSAATEFRKSLNHCEMLHARFAAESGSEYITAVLTDADFTGSSPSAAMTSLATSLNNEITGVTIGSPYNDTITVPSMSVSDDQSFTATLTMDSSGTSYTILAEITGTCDQTDYVVKRQFNVQLAGAMFEYAIVSNGKLSASGQAAVKTSDPDHLEFADVCSLSDDGVALEVSGKNALFHGVMNATDPSASPSIHKKAKIGIGDQSKPAFYDPMEYVNVGVGANELDTVDLGIFETFINTNLTTMSGNISKGTYTNIRIPANSNPTVASKTVINGMLYIEKPNNVSFAGKAEVNGIIVAGDLSGETPTPGDNSQLHCNGQFTLNGVNTLNSGDHPTFGELKALAGGTTIIAPDFDMQAAGQFNVDGETIAVESISWSGQATGFVRGSIVHYGDEVLNITGQTDMTFDRTGMTDQPPGFAGSNSISLDTTYYDEE